MPLPIQKVTLLPPTWLDADAKFLTVKAGPQTAVHSVPNPTLTPHVIENSEHGDAGDALQSLPQLYLEPEAIGSAEPLVFPEWRDFLVSIPANFSAVRRRRRKEQ
ncbi:hypothetical protein CKAH01_10035 [Colletotrichum kahawae]|uniref:Uncharacterized protein n=1 Tax=Colletotrichum kahawae TaxID=34407 RepID=A0AAE0CY01_COLKA|nr:hypothetical protein CKAH01_10035 [Colletotrichum kahawae]